MSRKFQRDRAGYSGHLQIRCECDKLLARMDETLPGVVDGAYLVRSGAKGDPLTGCGWHQLVCPQCGRDHRVRENGLLRGIRAAKARGSRRVVLPLAAHHDAV